MTTVRPSLYYSEHDGHILADDIFKRVFYNEIFLFPQVDSILLDQLKKITTLVQVMAWRRTGDKALPEPILPYINDAYGVTRSQ